MIVPLLALLLSAPPPATAPQSTDTVAITREVRKRLASYYWVTNRPPVGPREGTCSAELGQDCFGGDPDRGGCPIDVRCNPDQEIRDIVELLKTGAREHPDARFVVGYATYALLKFGRHLEAFEVANGCMAAEWWCGLLRGYVFHGVGSLDEAEEEFRKALTAAPDSVACVLTEAPWALGDRDRERLQEIPCQERLAASDTVWWLGDPLYAVQGNDRWVEQVSRTLGTRFFLLVYNSHLARDLSGSHVEDWLRDWLRARRIPRGTWDSWENLGMTYAMAHRGILYEFSTSRKAARYHFVPDFEGRDFYHPVWRLDATLDDEGYTPPYGLFYELPVQIARFRRADSLLVAVAGTLAGSPLAEATNTSAHLILSDGPERFPVQLASALHAGRAVFLAQAPPERYVTSFEVLSEAGFGRHRVMMEPLEMEGPGVSDLLLYRPVGNHEPDSLLIAAGMMLGETVVEKGDPVGVYWESYGAGAEEGVSVEIQVRREGGGVLDWVTQVLPGSEGERGRLSWTEPAPGPVFRNAVVLGVEGLNTGRYLLRLRTWWQGQEPLEVERAFEVR